MCWVLNGSAFTNTICVNIQEKFGTIPSPKSNQLKTLDKIATIIRRTIEQYPHALGCVILHQNQYAILQFYLSEPTLQMSDLSFVFFFFLSFVLHVD